MTGDDVKKNEETAGASKDAGPRSSSQTFRAVGLVEAVCGDLILRGRNGERDHLFRLDKAIDRYFETEQMVAAMCRNAIGGWDTLMDINSEFKAKILEAIAQRRSLNIELPETGMDKILDFEQRFGSM